MIKLIIFDLDGILLESKDTHFKALNMALKDMGYSQISYKDHISKYDGKPTREKLDLLCIPQKDHTGIYRKKQSYTMDLLTDSVSLDIELVDIFKKLKNDGYIIHVASNSIRCTVETILSKLGLLNLVDFYISNEDVKIGKPHPEMYLKCLLQAKVGPRESLVIEDSYVGRKGGYNSGAYLSAIKKREEVTYNMIKSDINKYESVKQKWRDLRLNIVIPMAGAGRRFSEAGYTFPKPLIEIHGKSMIQVVVENLNIDAKYIYVIRQEHYDKYSLKPMLEMLTPGCDIVMVDKITEGAACTVLLTQDYIDNDRSLLIANSDQYMEWDSSHFMYTAQNGNIDGFIPIFFNTHPRWSYAKVDEDGYITDVQEKQVISNHATVGLYYWKRGSDFVKYSKQMISKNIRVNGEFYVCPVYNEAIQDGKKFKVYAIDKMYGLGTPEDLNFFLQTHGGCVGPETKNYNI